MAVGKPYLIRVNFCVPWKIASRNEKTILQVLSFQQVGVCHKLIVGAGIIYDTPKECFMEVELTLELITLFC